MEKKQEKKFLKKVMAEKRKATMEGDGRGCIVIIPSTQKRCGRKVKKNDRCGYKSHQKWKPTKLPPLQPGKCPHLNREGGRRVRVRV